MTKALRLAQEELKQRADVFTHDALAWSLTAAGQLQEAQCEMEKALAEGTKDGRLFFHAAVIATKAGRPENAHHWFEKASEYIHLLLPSEQQQLQAAAPDTNGEAGFEATLHPASADISTRGD